MNRASEVPPVVGVEGTVVPAELDELAVDELAVELDGGTVVAGVDAVDDAVELSVSIAGLSVSSEAVVSLEDGALVDGALDAGTVVVGRVVVGPLLALVSSARLPGFRIAKAFSSATGATDTRSMLRALLNTLTSKPLVVTRCFALLGSKPSKSSPSPWS